MDNNKLTPQQITDYIIENSRIEFSQLIQKPNSKMVGRAVLIFGEVGANHTGYHLQDGFEIKGFKILTDGKYKTDFVDKNGGNLYIGLPSIFLPNGRPYNIVYFNEASRQKLEKRILRKYISSL